MATSSTRTESVPALRRGLTRRLAPKSLLARSLLIIVIPLIVLQIVTTVIFFERHWDTVTRRLAGSVAGDIAWIIELLREFPDRQAWIVEQALGRVELRVMLRPGEILPNEEPRTGFGRTSTILAHEMRQRVQRPSRIDSISYEDLIEIRVQLPDAVLEVFAPRKRLFSITTYIFVMWMVGTSLILFGVATVFMRNQVRPIRRLAAAAEGFGTGRDDEDFRPQGAAEVRQAGAAFNLMRERIRRFISQRTEMLAGVSHDLRTPLTRMRLQLALLGDKPEVKELRADVDEMQRMVEGYLAFARGDEPESPTVCSITGLLASVVEQTRQAGTSIDLEASETLHASVRSHQLRRCFANIVENAARHADRVVVRCSADESSAEIVIDDDGPGIPQHLRDDAFRPFVRLDTSRNPTTGGSGLGLAIARDIMQRHGGDIFLEESPLGGLRARLRLPL
ncbi:MAG: ATP-binding protein [Acetobacterales bacterium]